MKRFDYVVVGGGSAGCTVASRLSENGEYSVALLEAGGTHNNPLISIPFNFAFTVPKGSHNWSFETGTATCERPTLTVLFVSCAAHWVVQFLDCENDECDVEICLVLEEVRGLRT